jgi:hypothetical protein
VSRAAYATVQKAFAAEVERVFGPIARDLGLSGPEPRSVVIPGLVYGLDGLRYHVYLDTDDMTVDVRVELDEDGTRLVVEVDRVAGAARLSPPGRVTRSARTLRGLRAALESWGPVVRLVHPLVTSAGAADLMRSAGARELRLG